MSRRARRTHRRLKRSSGPAQIILTSLIDIFTVLLFFLLIQAANVEALPEPRLLKLPESTAQQKTKKTPVLMVNDADISLDGRRIIGVPEALQNGRDDIPALEAALKTTFATTPAPVTPATPATSATPAATTTPVDALQADSQITIMGDKAIPYRLLRKVMQTCTQAGYGRIALAVQRKTS
jgi:biopolymer transport protein TolR